MILNVADANSEIIRQNNLRKKPKLFKLEDEKALYESFKKTQTPVNPLYSSCGFDITPSFVFENVTYLDLDEENKGSIVKIQEQGFEGLKLDILEYDKKHDLVILRRPVIPFSFVEPNLSSKGHIISDNYHGTASEIFETNSYQFIGGLKLDKRGVAKLDSDLDHFDKVKTFEEHQKHRPEHLNDILDLALSLNELGALNLNKTSPNYVWSAYYDQIITDKPYKKIASKYVFEKN
jgi:hypothetical protein